MKSFAFVFPGQGSQSVGMLDAWGDNAAVRQTLEEASAALNVDMARLIHDGPKDELDLTTNTQPVMLTAGIACYRAWLAETQAAPSVVAGHSLGEYSALVAAGALRLGRRVAAGALSRPGDAGSGAGRRRRDGGDPRARCRVGARRLRAAARETGEVGRRRRTSTIRSRP